MIALFFLNATIAAVPSISKLPTERKFTPYKFIDKKYNVMNSSAISVTFKLTNGKTLD